MVFKNNFVAVIKLKNRILREVDGCVTLPFGSEYSIYLKNLHTERALVSIEIDGDDVLDYNQIIIPANSDMELKGFLKDNNVTNKFKFIEKTEEISEYRGDKIEDGLIRIEYQFEKPTKIDDTFWFTNTKTSLYQYPFHTCDDNNIQVGGTPYWLDGVDNRINTTYNYSVSNSSGGNVSYSCNISRSLTNDIPEDGITVKGSDDVNQNFINANIGCLESDINVIVLKLKGKNSKDKIVKKAITVNKNIICPTCGRSARSSNKYCNNCGTYLQ